MDELTILKKRIDKFVSERLKLRRISLGITQQELGSAINVRARV